jgi:hypothetical protein
MEIRKFRRSWTAYSANCPVQPTDPVTEFNQFEGSLLSPTEEANTRVLDEHDEEFGAKTSSADTFTSRRRPPLTGGDAHYGFSQTGS